MISSLDIYLHCSWTTHQHNPVLRDIALEKLIRHIRENARQKGIQLLAINGFLDQFHILITIRHDQSVSHVIKLIKGESSHWANKNGIFEEKLQWQRGFQAKSVSPRHAKRAVRQINKLKQDEHQIRVSQIRRPDEFNKSGRTIEN